MTDLGTGGVANFGGAHPGSRETWHEASKHVFGGGSAPVRMTVPLGKGTTKALPDQGAPPPTPKAPRLVASPYRAAFVDRQRYARNLSGSDARQDGRFAESCLILAPAHRIVAHQHAALGK